MKDKSAEKHKNSGLELIGDVPRKISDKIWAAIILNGKSKLRLNVWSPKYSSADPVAEQSDDKDAKAAHQKIPNDVAALKRGANLNTRQAAAKDTAWDGGLISPRLPITFKRIRRAL